MAAVAVLAAVGGYFVAMSLDGGATSQRLSPSIAEQAIQQPDELLGQRRPDFTLRDTAGTWVTADDFNGQPLLLNFWATWCKPCVEEMPMLSELQQGREAQGLQVVGIALDDPDRAADFAEEIGVSYPVLVGQTDVVLTGRRYGNSSGMLPFSVLVDRAGVIRWTHLRALERAVVEEQLHKLDERQWCLCSRKFNDLAANCYHRWTMCRK